MDFLNLLANFNYRLDHIEAGVMSDEYFDPKYKQISELNFLESHLQSEPTTKIVNGTKALLARVERIEKKGLSGFQSIYYGDTLIGTPEDGPFDIIYSTTTYDGTNCEEYIKDELIYYKTRLTKLISTYSVINTYPIKEMMAEETSAKIKLDLSVAHIGMLIGVLFDAKILDKKNLSKKKVLDFVVRFFSAKETDNIDFSMLKNKSTRVTENEWIAFLHGWAQRIALSVSDFNYEEKPKVDQDKK